MLTLALASVVFAGVRNEAFVGGTSVGTQAVTLGPGQTTTIIYSISENPEPYPTVSFVVTPL